MEQKVKTIEERQQAITAATEALQKVSDNSRRLQDERDQLQARYAAGKKSLVQAKKDGKPCAEITRELSDLDHELEALAEAIQTVSFEIVALKKREKLARLQLWTTEKEKLFLNSLEPEILGHLSAMLEWEQQNLLSPSYINMNPDFKDHLSATHLTPYEIAIGIFSILKNRMV